MEKITFVNESEPYLSAENLNAMQDNIEEAIKDTYSTEEQVIGTWINQKPIYRKVVEFTTNTVINQWKTIYTIPNIEMPITLRGMFWNGGAKFTIPKALENEDMILYCDTNTGNIGEQHNYDYANNRPAFAILEYTKTTD